MSQTVSDAIVIYNMVIDFLEDAITTLTGLVDEDAELFVDALMAGKDNAIKWYGIMTSSHIYGTSMGELGFSFMFDLICSPPLPLNQCWSHPGN